MRSQYTCTNPAAQGQALPPEAKARFNTPFFGKKAIGNFTHAWADELTLDRVQEAFDPFECHHYELPEYADKKYGWGVALLGDSREGPAFYASHGPENQGMTTEQTAPVMPGISGFFRVSNFRRFRNQYDGEVFMRPEGGHFSISVAVPGLRVFEDRFKDPVPRAFSLSAWAHSITVLTDGPAPEDLTDQENYTVMPFLPPWEDRKKEKGLDDFLEKDASCYFIRSVIRSTELVTLYGEDVWKLVVTMKEPLLGETGIDIPVYCFEKDWEGESPKAGMRILAAIWLLARFIPAEEVEPPRRLNPDDPIDLEKAQSGDAEAMVKVAKAYLSDPFYEAPFEAFTWFQKAAEKENPEGILGLADCYLNGTGVKKNRKEAKKLVRALADKDYPDAVMKLADILDLDAVTPKEARRVRKIYERAVSLGAVKAYIPLISNALIGCESDNFASDYPRAVQFAMDLRETGADPVTLITVSQMLSDEGLRKYAKLIADLAELAAEGGDSLPKAALALYYAQGFGRKRDPKKANQLLIEAGENGSIRQKLQVADTLLAGKKGFIQDVKTAVRFYEDAAMMGSPDGAASFGWCLAMGFGTVENLEAGLRWLQKAIDEGSDRGRFYYGVLLSDGQKLKKDERKGEKLIREAAENGLPNAVYRLSLDCFDKGLNKEAFDWRIRYYGLAEADESVNDIVTLLPEHGYDAEEHQLEFILGVLLLAGETGDPLALVTLGDIYVTGAYGVRVNVKDAKKLYREAAEMGYKMAETRLAQLSGK